MINLSGLYSLGVFREKNKIKNLTAAQGYQRDLSEWNCAFVQQVHGSLPLVVIFSKDGSI